jgi:hypothetical protein
MTRCLLIILLNLILALPNYSQIIKYPNKSDSTIISIPEYYKKLGKVFSSDYRPNQLYLNDYVKGYKLTENEIVKTEILLQENYPNQSKRIKNRNHWKKHWRQYLAFINDYNEKIIFLHLEKYNHKPSVTSIEWWSTVVSIVNEEWDEHHTDDFIINLTTNNIVPYSKYIEGK